MSKKFSTPKIAIEVNSYSCRVLIVEGANLHTRRFFFGLAPFSPIARDLELGIEFALREAQNEFGVKLFSRGKLKFPVHAYISDEFKGSKLVNLTFKKAKVLDLISSRSGFAYLDLDLFSISSSADDVVKYLPFQESVYQVEDYLRNYNLFEVLAPSNSRDLGINNALVKASLRQKDFLKEAPGVIFGGVFSEEIPHSIFSLSLAADGIQPKDVFKVYTDRQGILPLLYTLFLAGAIKEEELGVYELPYDGVILSFEKRVSLAIERGFKKESKIDIGVGDVFNIPAAFGERIVFSFRDGVRRYKWEVQAGEAGVVLDGRGRPFKFPPSTAEGKSIIRSWNKALFAGGLVTGG